MKKDIKFLGKIVWLYTKYQVVTKGIFVLIVFPIATFILNLLLRSSGRTNISSGDYLRFLFSFQGVGLLILALILLILLTGTDINAFIIMSALIKEKKIDLTAKQLLAVGLRSLKTFLKPSGLLIMVYVGLVIPLLGIGITVGPTKDFAIPNFIIDVIFKNPIYQGIYVIILAILGYISIRYVFVFHYILLLKNNIGDGLKNASNLMKKYWKSFILDFLLKSVTLVISVGSILVISAATLFLISRIFIFNALLLKIWTIFSLGILAQMVAFITFMSVPIFCDRITALFYEYNEREGNKIELDFDVKEFENDAKKIKFKTKVSIVAFLTGLLVFNAINAIITGVYFDEIFRDFKHIDIVAHRAGGDLAAENSIEGLKQAIAKGAAWSEIDVQRTKDGKYVINHDGTFARLTGVNKASTDLSLQEIKKLKIKDQFDASRPSQEVASLEEFLDEAKGKIGLFIELKGASADSKMADDVIRMVRDRNMEDEVAILSLDYPLIQYIEKNYHDIRTGFLYFFALGKPYKLDGDILIMEEREATPAKIDEIHSAGKIAIVWTVNTDASIEKFVNSNVDGIITDYVEKVKEGLKKRENRTDLEILIYHLFGN